ncbi:MAG: D-alanyl-D-alanine carboxypeptidase [Clostridia bacterium]|nr:D-alanyl-D-alanine carboxypeptidase [Clostridia bacterium]
MQRRDHLRTVLCILLSLLFVFPLFVIPIGAAQESPSTAEATAVYFYHLQTGEAVLAKNESTPLPAGPTVKLLAGLIFCEEYRYRLNESVEVTDAMKKGVAGYQLKIKTGDTLSIEQLLYAAICGSYNDAYYILANHLSGSIAGFSARMNQRAGELGVLHSSFVEPTGVEDASIATATDLSKIALAAYQNELYMKICTTPRYQMPETLYLDSFLISNRNALITSTSTTKYYNAKCRGMVAGSTSVAGSCVITVASHKGHEYISIVMGAKETAESNGAYLLTNRLVDWIYRSYGEVEILSPDTVLCKIPIMLSLMTTEIGIGVKEPVTAYLPLGLDLEKDITYSIRLEHTSLEAPVTEGLFVGYVAILYEGKLLETVPIYTKSGAERTAFMWRLQHMEEWLSDRRVLSGGIFFLVVLTGWIVTEQIVIRTRHKKWNRYFKKKRKNAKNDQNHQ